MPTDNYTLDEAVRDGFLVPPKAVSVPLRFQREGISYDQLSEEEKEEWDYSYRLEAHVTDASRREMQGAASFIGTRGKTVADAYPERYLYYQGDAAKIRVKTADYSGHPVSEKVTLKFIEQKWQKVEKQVENNGYKYTDVDYILHERELG